MKIKNLTLRIIATINNLKKLLDIDDSIKIVLTGSCSLKLLGLLKREPIDIDLLFVCDNEITRINLHKKISLLHEQSENNSELLKLSHLISIRLNSEKIDCLIVNRTVDICDLEIPFLVATPYETMSIKKTFTPDKFYNDIESIFTEFTNLKKIVNE
jgi:hypothetical protein